MMPRFSIISTFIFTAIFSFSSASFAAEDANNKSPRLVAHLLDYLAKDYGGAVAKGKVTSKSEYQEQVEFAASALSMSREFPELKSDVSIIPGIQSLNDLIAKKADPSNVSALALSLKQKVILAANILESPKRWPNLAHGEEIFQRTCVSCHGVQGDGAGVAAKGLSPKPTNFLDPVVAKAINPFRAFNTIRVGIPGTAMIPWPMFADEDVWDIAFYVNSLHFQGTRPRASVQDSELVMASTRSDEQLMESLPGTEEEKKDKIAAIRLHSIGNSGSSGPGSKEVPSSLDVAQKYLTSAQETYSKKDFDGAKHVALLAYLEGIEPVEPRLRANDPDFVIILETKMAAVRSTIEAHASLSEVQARISDAREVIKEAQARLTSKAPSPWVAFLLTVGILLREGFEAVLILIALLAVIKAAGSQTAAKWVHAGWISALGVGTLTWFFSGFLMGISGAQREMLEGVTSVLAVVVLLYIGFWLHSKTEIGRWTAFIEGSVKRALEGGNLWGLAAISFMAVFREAFETVLFMRAITLEGGDTGTTAMAIGVVVSLTALIALSWAILKYSAKLPIRKIFSISSIMMAVLAVILTGKGLHALQETGTVSVTPFGGHFRVDLLGVFPTLETFVPQIVIAIFIYGLWHLGKRKPGVSSAQK